MHTAEVMCASGLVAAPVCGESDGVLPVVLQGQLHGSSAERAPRGVRVRVRATRASVRCTCADMVELWHTSGELCTA